MYNEEVSKETLDKAIELAKRLLSKQDFEKNSKLAEKFKNNSFKVVALLNNVLKDKTRDDSILLSNGMPESLVRIVNMLQKTDAETFCDYTFRVNYSKSRMLKLIFIHLMKLERSIVLDKIANEPTLVNSDDRYNEQLFAFAEYIVKTNYNKTEKHLKSKGE